MIGTGGAEFIAEASTRAVMRTSRRRFGTIHAPCHVSAFSTRKRTSHLSLSHRPVQPWADPRLEATRVGHEAMLGSTDPRFCVRVMSEVLLFNTDLLARLVHELGGDWNWTTVSELTTIPSDGVETCIREVQINGERVRLLQRGTTILPWRAPFCLLLVCPRMGGGKRLPARALLTV